MGQIVILEGPDGGGKTTIARKLVEEKGFTYVHCGPPRPGEDLLHRYALLLYQAYLDSKPTVFDRLHIGESIYGPLFRDVDLIGPEGQTLLNRMIKGYGASVHLIMPPFEICLLNWKKKTNDFVPNESLFQRIWDRYLEFAQDHVVWDYTQDEEFLPENSRALPFGTIGDPYPNYCVVGEVANHVDLDAPFISLSGSSHYLFKCLQDAGYEEHELAFVNAYRLNGDTVALKQVFEELNWPIPILLGNKAQNAYQKQVDTRGVNLLPHPAYWMRFHSGERKRYVEMLKKARGYRVQ